MFLQKSYIRNLKISQAINIAVIGCPGPDRIGTYRENLILHLINNYLLILPGYLSLSE